MEENGDLVSKSEEQDKFEETTKPRPVEPYRPPVPFPQRVAKAKLEAKFGNFLEILKKLQINIPFLDAISEMRSDAKFLKEMLSNRRKFQENVMISLTEKCSAIFQNKLPPKLKNSGTFFIPCATGNIIINRALFDLGVSVSLMPHSTCKRLQVVNSSPLEYRYNLRITPSSAPLESLRMCP